MSENNPARLSEYAEGISLGSTPLEQTAGIVAAYVSNNHIQPTELPALIATVHAALIGLGSSAAAAASAEPAADLPTPSQIRKSIRPDALVSFIDGKPYKTLKRHLTKHGLDGRSYRERFGLPADYPMTAAAYSEQRSALAKALGLGRPGAMAETAPTTKGRKAA